MVFISSDILEAHKAATLAFHPSLSLLCLWLWPSRSTPPVCTPYPPSFSTVVEVNIHSTCFEGWFTLADNANILRCSKMSVISLFYENFPNKRCLSNLLVVVDCLWLCPLTSFIRCWMSVCLGSQLLWTARNRK